MVQPATSLAKHSRALQSFLPNRFCCNPIVCMHTTLLSAPTATHVSAYLHCRTTAERFSFFGSFLCPTWVHNLHNLHNLLQGNLHCLSS